MWDITTPLPIQIAVIYTDNIQVNAGDEAFQHLRECALDYKRRYSGCSIGYIEGIQSARNLFRAIGIDPTRRRPSSEALLNRVLKGKELYSVNSLVDIGNWCSLEFLLPICVYDTDKIVGQVTIRLGKEGESYLGLNDRTINLHNRYVIADERGPFGSPITDSQRTAVDTNTQRATLGIFAPGDYDTALLNEKAHVFASRVKDICGGEVVSIDILV